MAGPARTDPARVAALPPLSRLALVGAVCVLAPGIVVFVALKLAGLGDGAAGAFGLLGMLAGMAGYPFYLRRLGRRLPS